MSSRPVTKRREPRITTPRFQQLHRWRRVEDKAGQLQAARIYLGLEHCGESVPEA